MLIARSCGSEAYLARASCPNKKGGTVVDVGQSGSSSFNCAVNKLRPSSSNRAFNKLSDRPDAKDSEILYLEARNMLGNITCGTID